jgi:hypothetical protein
LGALRISGARPQNAAIFTPKNARAGGEFLENLIFAIHSEERFMRRNRWIFVLIVPLLSSLACNAITRGAQPTATEFAPDSGSSEVATEAPSDANTAEPEATIAQEEPTADASIKTEFPLPTDVSNFTSTPDGGINFQAKMSVKDAIAFYRDAFTTAGYKERTINTAITDTTFSMVFDGHSNGKAIVIQGVDLQNGSTNINIRFEDI